MALDLQVLFTASSDCLSLSVYDSTGIYSSSNTGGYGAPNPTIASAQTAEIEISKLEDYATNLYSDPVTINVGPTATPPDNILPNITNTPFIITGELAGYGDDSELPDGFYKIVYTVTGDSGGAYTATVTKYVALTCQIDCCYRQLANEVALCSCDCVELEERLRKIAYFRRQLSAAVNSGNINAIMKNIDFLTSLCSDNCSCC